MVRHTGSTKNGEKGLATIINDTCATKKAPVKSAILINYNQFNYLVIKHLLPDAKLREDFAEDFVSADFSCDAAEGAECFAKVLREQVGG